MKRFERLGSVAFVTVVITLVFHLIAMSFNRWRVFTCHGCNPSELLSSWSTGISSRCYQASFGPVFNPVQSGQVNEGYPTEVCISNLFFIPKDLEHASYCLNLNLNTSDYVCAFGRYDKTLCQCDYLPRTKLILGTTIISALCLGVLVFLSHLVAFVKKDYILQWIVPICYTLLFVSIIFMIITLVAAGSNLQEDINELRYSKLLLQIVHINETSVDPYVEKVKDSLKATYTAKLGWCFGMEILAFYFATASMVLYLIIYWVKRRPNSITPIM